MQIYLADSAAKIARCFPVMVQLRQHLSETKFIERVQMQQAEGYRLASLACQKVVKRSSRQRRAFAS